MNPYSGIHPLIAVLAGKPERFPGRWNVRANGYCSADAPICQAAQNCIAVAVEGMVAIMCMWSQKYDKVPR